VLILFVLIIFFIGKWTGLINVQNWWAIIFWIPAISSFGNVLKEIRLKKGFSFVLVSGISGIIFPITISIGFFIGTNWIQYAPIFVIISGLILIQTGFVESREPVGEFFQNVKAWAISIGLAVAIIGIILLVPTFNYDLSLNQISHWFGLSFVFCSSGGFYYLFRRKKPHRYSPLLILINLFFAMILFFMGTFVFFKRSFDFSGGITLIVLFLFLAIFLIKDNSNIKNSQ